MRDVVVVTTKKPTIGHLLPWGTIGGIEVATLRIIEGMKDQFRHVAFCLPGATELQEACANAGAEVLIYHPPEPSLRHGLRFLRESLAVAHQMASSQIDLVHASETKAAYHNSLAAVLARVPIITHVRSQYANIPLRDRLTFMPLAGYVFVSKDARVHFGMSVPEEKTRILYDAVDAVPEPMDKAAIDDLRKELGVEPGATLVGMIARVAPVKDYDTLADAAARVIGQRPDVQFLIVGDNANVDLNRRHYEHVRARLRELGIEKRFIFAGHRSDVGRITAALDIFVLSTHREGLPLSILEAMSMAKPVIATSVGGIPEIIEHGVTGFLCAHKNSHELADAILLCVEDPATAKRIAFTAQARSRIDYNPRVFRQNLAKIYNDFLGIDEAAGRNIGCR